MSKYLTDVQNRTFHYENGQRVYLDGKPDVGASVSTSPQRPAQQTDAVAMFFLVSFVILAGLGGIYWWVTSQPSSSSVPAAQSAPPSPSVPAPPQDVPLSSVTWSEISAIYNLKSQYTDLQKDEYWKQYKGKKVRWSGTASSVSDSFGSLSLQVKMNPDTFTSDVLVTLKDSQRSKALTIKQGDFVTFTGILDRWGSILDVSLSDGEID